MYNEILRERHDTQAVFIQNKTQKPLKKIHTLWYKGHNYAPCIHTSHVSILIIVGDNWN